MGEWLNRPPVGARWHGALFTRSLDDDLPRANHRPQFRRACAIGGRVRPKIPACRGWLVSWVFGKELRECVELISYLRAHGRFRALSWARVLAITSGRCRTDIDHGEGNSSTSDRMSACRRYPPDTPGPTRVVSRQVQRSAARRADRTLDTELTKMMIQMFVHQGGPLCRGQPAKERMRMGRADGCAA